MVYQEKVLLAINSLKAKRQDLILNERVYTPSLGSNYTRRQLRVWINKRKNFLINARDLSETEFEAMKDNWYSNLTPYQKSIVDIIWNGREEDLDLNETQWEATIPARLYYYVTTPIE